MGNFYIPSLMAKALLKHDMRIGVICVVLRRKGKFRCGCDTRSPWSVSKNHPEMWFVPQLILVATEQSLART